jgi:putative flippase GtrA
VTNKGLRFLVAGTANTVVGYSLFVLLVYLGLHYNIALAIAYICGGCQGYILNRYWTFSSTTSNRKDFPKYVALYMAVIMLNAVILNALVFLDIVGPIVGQLISLCVVTLFSFQLQNNWVFSGNK